MTKQHVNYFLSYFQISSENHYIMSNYHRLISLQERKLDDELLPPLKWTFDPQTGSLDCDDLIYDEKPTIYKLIASYNVQNSDIKEIISREDFKSWMIKSGIHFRNLKNYSSNLGRIRLSEWIYCNLL